MSNSCIEYPDIIVDAKMIVSMWNINELGILKINCNNINILDVTIFKKSKEISLQNSIIVVPSYIDTIVPNNIAYYCSIDSLLNLLKYIGLKAEDMALIMLFLQELGWN